MPLEGLEDEGLPRNPNLQLAQLKFLLTLEDVNKEEIWRQLLEGIKEKGKKMAHDSAYFNYFIDMGPFYSSVCKELQHPVDKSLLEQLETTNTTKIKVSHNSAQYRLGPVQC